MGIYVFLPYSLAFLALGLVMAMAARAPVPVLPRIALWCLSAFGMLHGLHEWAEMADAIQRQIYSESGLSWLRVSGFLLSTTSFVFLMQAGIEVLVQLRRWPGWSRAAPLALLLVWGSVSVAPLQYVGPASSAVWADSTDALGRYLLGLPGALVASYALLMSARREGQARSERVPTYLTVAALAAVGYALATGVIVPPAPFPPATLLNTRTFESVVGIRVEALRAVFALIMAGCLAESCIVESARMQLDLQRLRDELLSTAAHELKTPVTIIKGYAQMLSRWEAHDEREAMAFEVMKRQSDRIDRLVQELLEVSRLKLGRLDTHLERFDLGELAADVVDHMQPTTEQHRLLLHREARVTVRADRARIEQVLVDLLENALKFSPGGGEIDTTVAVRNAQALVSVRDRGIGIPREKQPHIFESFYRAHVGTEHDYAGIGIGLHLVREVVMRQGGRVWFESEAGKGSTFYFTLPLTKNGSTDAAHRPNHNTAG